MHMHVTYQRASNPREASNRGANPNTAHTNAVVLAPSEVGFDIKMSWATEPTIRMAQKMVR